MFERLMFILRMMRFDSHLERMINYQKYNHRIWIEYNFMKLIAIAFAISLIIFQFNFDDNCWQCLFLLRHLWIAFGRMPIQFFCILPGSAILVIYQETIIFKVIFSKSYVGNLFREMFEITTIYLTNPDCHYRFRLRFATFLNRKQLMMILKDLKTNFYMQDFFHRTFGKYFHTRIFLTLFLTLFVV